MAKITVKETLATIRNLGISAMYNSEYREYRINYRLDDPRRTEMSSYFTNDAEDAIATARVMLLPTVK